MNSLKRRKSSSSSSSSESSVSSESSKTVSAKKTNKKEKELLSKKRYHRERSESLHKEKKKINKKRKYSSSPEKDRKKRFETEKRVKVESENQAKYFKKEEKKIEEIRSKKVDNKQEKIENNKPLQTKESISITNQEEDKVLKSTTQIINEKEEAPKQLGVNIIKQDQAALTSRAGGVYIPPFKLAMMYEEIRQKNDKSSVEYQKMMFEMLRKSINGIINKVNISNIQNVIFELFNENLIRGKGLLARAIIKAQMSSPNFTHVYASLIAVINTKVYNYLIISYLT
jgi:pre-mRNA-splicing factor CWC22